MRQRVKFPTRWRKSLSVSTTGSGVVSTASPPSWNLPATINVAQSGTVSVRQYALNAADWTIAVTGLPAGVTYNSGTESLDGAATGTASATATFTLSKAGESDIVDTATVALASNLAELGTISIVSGPVSNHEGSVLGQILVARSSVVDGAGAVDMDWEITGVDVSPSSGTLSWPASGGQRDDTKKVQFRHNEYVTVPVQGTFTLSNVRRTDGGAGLPILGTLSTTVTTVPADPGVYTADYVTSHQKGYVGRAFPVRLPTMERENSALAVDWEVVGVTSSPQSGTLTWGFEDFDQKIAWSVPSESGTGTIVFSNLRRTDIGVIAPTLGTASIPLTISAESPPSWMVPSGHYEGYFALHTIYPRPDTETNTWARHRHAYPGLLYEIPIGVQFGAWPYKYEMTTGPSWLGIVAETPVWDGVDKFEIPEGYGVLSGIAPATPQAAETVIVTVTDQNGDSIDVEFTVTVSADNFVFLDPVGGDDATATGLIGAPFKEVSALQDADLGTGKICYVRSTAALPTGYIPTPARQFRLDGALEPRSYLAYPGDTVVVNCQNQSGFSNGSGVRDGFLADMEIRDTNQVVRSASNVRVISRVGGPAVRECFWKLKNIDSYSGTSASDNVGFIISLRNGASSYIYCADVVGENMSGGTNGPAIFQWMQVSRVLVERVSAINCLANNNAMIDLKHEGFDFEVRNCDMSQAVGTTNIKLSAGSSSSFVASDRCVAVYNKVPGKIEVSFPEWPCADFYFYRNNAVGEIGLYGGSIVKGDVFTRNNLSAAYESGLEYIFAKQVFGVGDVITTDFDANINTTGATRSSYLGTKGAEIA